MCCIGREEVENVTKLVYCQNTNKRGVTFWAKDLHQRETWTSSLWPLTVHASGVWSCLRSYVGACYIHTKITKYIREKMALYFCRWTIRDYFTHCVVARLDRIALIDCIYRFLWETGHRASIVSDDGHLGKTTQSSAFESISYCEAFEI